MSQHMTSAAVATVPPRITRSKSDITASIIESTPSATIPSNSCTRSQRVTRESCAVFPGSDRSLDLRRHTHQAAALTANRGCGGTSEFHAMILFSSRSTGGPRKFRGANYCNSESELRMLTATADVNSSSKYLNFLALTWICAVAA